MPSPIHPTAIVDPAATLAPDVLIGAYAIIEGSVVLGPGCVIEPHAQLIGPVTAGANNTFGRGCIIGGPPQHLSADGRGADIVIGAGNTFREHVTVNRGSSAGKATRIGDQNYLMVGSHVAHDCAVGNRCIFANNALLGGHVTVGDNVFLSGNSAVHQFVRVGRLALLSGTSAATQDLPPFTIHQNINQIVGVNVVGMRRAGISPDEINAVRRAFRILFVQRNLLTNSVARLEREFADSPCVAELAAFIRGTVRGIPTAFGRADRRAA